MAVLLFVVPPVTFRDPFDRTLQPPRIVVIIPARFESSRFPGKPLADLAGRPMVEHVYRRAATARGVDAVVVATDDERIAAAVRGFGGICRLTSPAHRTGTDRIAEVAEDLACDIIVNVQGDEPLIEPTMVEEVIAPLDADAALSMSTLCRRIVNASDYVNPHVVKVVTSLAGDALYFSRAAIPFAPAAGVSSSHPVHACKHIGIYGYRRSFVRVFAELPHTSLETLESLEQLRALEHGVRIRVVETQHDSIGVDTPEDLERVRRQLMIGARG